MEKQTELQDNKIFLPAVVGPTASGKTRLAVDLALWFDCEIISCDSMQIYRELSISTARPTESEMHGVKHHLIGHVGLDEQYSVARYVNEANAAADDIISRGKTPLLCGGTGLYFSSLTEGILFDECPTDGLLREKLNREADSLGGAVMLERVRKTDPEYAEKLHENDINRIVRALEVYETTGKTMSEQLALSRQKESRFITLAIGLDYSDRSELYNRIEKRVDNMLNDGLLDEAKRVLNDEKLGHTARQAIGIKEFIPYFEDKATSAECAEILKKETRHYAKRQLTWFRRDSRIHWITVERGEKYENILSSAKTIMENNV